VVAAAGTYAIGPVLLGANWSNVRFAGIATLNRGTAVFNDVEASAQYHITPTLLAGVAYNYLHGSANGNVGGANYSQVGAGVEYVLSPRTDVYAAVDYQVANGHDSTGHTAVASLAGSSPSSNRFQTVGRVGLRHRF
jgi:predicted porin